MYGPVTQLDVLPPCRQRETGDTVFIEIPCRRGEYRRTTQVISDAVLQRLRKQTRREATEAGQYLISTRTTPRALR